MKTPGKKPLREKALPLISPDNDQWNIEGFDDLISQFEIEMLLLLHRNPKKKIDWKKLEYVIIRFLSRLEERISAIHNEKLKNSKINKIDACFSGMLASLIKENPDRAGELMLFIEDVILKYGELNSLNSLELIPIINNVDNTIRHIAIKKKEPAEKCQMYFEWHGNLEITGIREKNKQKINLAILLVKKKWLKNTSAFLQLFEEHPCNLIINWNPDKLPELVILITTLIELKIIEVYPGKGFYVEILRHLYDFHGNKIDYSLKDSSFHSKKSTPGNVRRKQSVSLIIQEIQKNQSKN